QAAPQASQGPESGFPHCLPPVRHGRVAARQERGCRLARRIPLDRHRESQDGIRRKVEPEHGATPVRTRPPAGADPPSCRCRPAPLADAVWTPDGKEIIFGSSRRSLPETWRLRPGARTSAVTPVLALDRPLVQSSDDSVGPGVMGAAEFYRAVPNSDVDVQTINQFAKFLARFEEGNSLRWHFDAGSGFWIASDACSSGTCGTFRIRGFQPCRRIAGHGRCRQIWRKRRRRIPSGAPRWLDKPLQSGQPWSSGAPSLHHEKEYHSVPWCPGAPAAPARNATRKVKWAGTVMWAARRES